MNIAMELMCYCKPTLGCAPIHFDEAFEQGQGFHLKLT
jgi:hypothetical protein